MFQNGRNSEFAKKNHLLSTLKYLLTSKRTKCPILKMGFQLPNVILISYTFSAIYEGTQGTFQFDS